MKITVAGCGKIGVTVVKALVNEGHDVTVIDINASVISDLLNVYDVMGVCGSASDCTVLKDAGTENAELFVATTGSDEMNMLTCFLAKKMGAKQTAARLRNPEYNYESLNFIKQSLDISMVFNPEYLAAQELFNMLKLPSASKVETFSRRNFEMIELNIKEDSLLANKSLSEIRKQFEGNFLVCAVRRGEKVIIPGGDFVLNAGDKIGLIAAPAQVQKLLKKAGIMKKQARNVIIAGASRTAFYLARMLLNAGNSVKIIDKSRERCNEFCAQLEGADIVCGDTLNQDVLAEEGINDCDAFVTLTGIDEENMILAFFAGTKNVPKVISKVNRDEFANLAETMGLESVVSPQKITSDVILRYARALENSIGSSVETLYKLMDDTTEALEFIIEDGCPLCGKAIKELNLRKSVLIAGIIRGRKPFIPSGDDVIEPADRVVIVSGGEKITDIKDILK